MGVGAPEAILTRQHFLYGQFFACALANTYFSLLFQETDICARPTHYFTLSLKNLLLFVCLSNVWCFFCDYEILKVSLFVFLCDSNRFSLGLYFF